MITRISLLAILFCSAAQATTYEKVGAKPSPSPSPTPPPSPWGFKLATKYQFSLHTATDAKKQSSITGDLKVSYKAAPKISIQAQLGMAQAIEPTTDYRVYNPEIRSFFLATEPESKIKFYLGPTITLPFGTDAREESLYFGIGIAARLLFDYRDEKENGFRAFYDFIFNKNIHQYETSILANVNNQYSLNHIVYAEFNFADVWSINTTFGFTSNWNYMNFASTNYSVEQEVDYSLSPTAYLFISHTRGGDFLSVNGQNYSFGLFNKDDSRLALGVGLNF